MSFHLLQPAGSLSTSGKSENDLLRLGVIVLIRFFFLSKHARPCFTQPA